MGVQRQFKKHTRVMWDNREEVGQKRMKGGYLFLLTMIVHTMTRSVRDQSAYFLAHQTHLV